jgi:endoglucanase
MHNLNEGTMNELWYDDNYTEEDFITGWSNIVATFGNKPNFLGIDLMNEPHGAATWGKNEIKTDWCLAAGRIAKEIKVRNPNFSHLILVEGIASGGAPSPYPTSDSAYEKFWGSNLDGVYTSLVDVGPDLENLLVYSSHLYGPSLYPHYAFSVDTFPNNMPAIWDKQVGFIEKYTGKAVIMGEWGGENTGDDALLQAVWVKYMADNCISDSFYWALNPNSSDLKGVLNKDWKTVNAGKLLLMEQAQPKPSIFTRPITENEVCLDYGEFANGVLCSASGEAL